MVLCINATGSSLQCHCSSIDNLSSNTLDFSGLICLRGKDMVFTTFNFGNGIMKPPRRCLFEGVHLCLFKLNIIMDIHRWMCHHNACDYIH